METSTLDTPAKTASSFQNHQLITINALPDGSNGSGTSELMVHRVESSRLSSIDWENLGFGVYFSDHMFSLDFKEGKWQHPRIVPYGKLEIESALCTLHYGQAVFEGLKAFQSIDGGINIFRPDAHFRRLNRSSEMLCIPTNNEQYLREALIELLKVDRQWIPTKRGSSLYIRPLIFGIDNFLGVQPSKSYNLTIMTSPVSSYYKEGMNPVKILVTDEYVRAVPGGLGAAKTPANYAASMLAAKKAKEQGYTQVLWLDGIEHHYIQEVGTMNIFFSIGDELITPPLEGTILAGITRDSVLTLARTWGMRVSERRISIHEVRKAHQEGLLKEVFGTGTAAVISPVGELTFKQETMVINDNRIGNLAMKFYNEITSIQYGEKPDPFGWVVKVQ